MRRALAKAPGLGTVVIGEGEKDGAPMLYNRERVGAGGAAFDIAVDPLECTTLCTNGLPGSLATIALAEEGALLRPGPSHYVENSLSLAQARDDAIPTPKCTPPLGTEGHLGAQIHEERMQFASIEPWSLRRENVRDCRDYAAVREIQVHD
jgi:hypothetical protein